MYEGGGGVGGAHAGSTCVPVRKRKRVFLYGRLERGFCKERSRRRTEKVNLVFRSFILVD